jgi:hypothetical protein
LLISRREKRMRIFENNESRRISEHK